MSDERHKTPSERCEAAAEAAIAAAGTECLRQSVGDVAEELEDLSDTILDTAGTLKDGDVAYVDVSIPNEGNDEVFNLLHRNGFTVESVEGEMTPEGKRVFITAERPEQRLAIGLDD